MKSILLIDRSCNDSESLEKRLRRYGFYVEIAESTAVARQLATETEFDLILMEFLPFDMDQLSQGVEAGQLGEELGKATAFIREIRACRVANPVIVYTSLKGELFETAALDAGADDYIVKSNSGSVLLARLHAHLRRRDGELGITAGRRTAVGRYILDRKNRILICDGRPVQLTPKEILLLERLASNPYRIVSAEEVLEYVWGEEQGRSQGALVALVKRLRQKMSKHEAEDPIQTVHGEGLRLSSAILNRDNHLFERSVVR
jgi:DNA-binding response OmpR family regulator